MGLLARLPLQRQLGRPRQAVRPRRLAGHHHDRRHWRPRVHDYTKDAITKLVAGGARPDMVQIGNEITPGMLIHRCDSGGLPLAESPDTTPSTARISREGGGGGTGPTWACC